MFCRVLKWDRLAYLPSLLRLLLYFQFLKAHFFAPQVELSFELVTKGGPSCLFQKSLAYFLLPFKPVLHFNSVFPQQHLFISALQNGTSLFLQEMGSWINHFQVAIQLILWCLRLQWITLDRESKHKKCHYLLPQKQAGSFDVDPINNWLLWKLMEPFCATFKEFGHFCFQFALLPAA